MSGNQICPRCDSPLPGGRWGDVCPACVARVSLPGARSRHPLQPPPSPGATARCGADSPDGGPTVPRQFGDYELIEEVARGGMGVVWRARQRRVDRIVALKLLQAVGEARPDETGRFRFEAAAVAALQHPHIVALHDFGEHEGQAWISMDFIEGQTLAEIVRNRPLAPHRAAELLKTVAEAVAYAHGRGILHRDLKPSNILIDREGRPRITDFGLAKRFEAPATPGGAVERSDATSPQDTTWRDWTLSGQLLGTPRYAPPEQLALRRGAVGPPSDVYSLGAVLYETLTGRPPFLAPTVEATLLQVIDADPPALRLHDPAIPADLETICLKCLEKAPGRRYATARELADELGRFLRHEPIVARPVGPLGRLTRWCRRKPGWATAAAMSLCLVGTIAAPTAAALLRRAEQRRAEAYRTERGLGARVHLRNATATFSEAGFPIQQAIDGNVVSGGWAIRESTGAADETRPQTAVFETVSDVGHPGGTSLTFTLIQNGGRQRLIGRFRLSVTSDERGTFADGLATGGDVEAQWTVLRPGPMFTAGGTVLTPLEDGSVLANPPLPPVDTYTISALTSATRITGVRLEVLAPLCTCPRGQACSSPMATSL